MSQGAKGEKRASPTDREWLVANRREHAGISLRLEEQLLGPMITTNVLVGLTTTK